MILKTRAFILVGITAAILLGILARIGHLAPERPAPILFFNGDILTMEDGPAPEAVLVVDGKIAHVGDEAELRSLAPRKTEPFDLHGKTLMPGFIEPHTHADLMAFLAPMVDLSPYAHDTASDVWGALEDAIAAAAPGEWIIAKGFDPDKTPMLRAPNLARLDSLAPDNPLYIIDQTLHAAWANSLALSEAGITTETVAPSPGSYFEKDEAGELTGYINEVEAIKLMNPALTAQMDIIGSAGASLQDYTAHGITTIATTGLFGVEASALDLYRYYSAERLPLKLRMAGFIGALPKRSPAPRHFIYLLADDIDHLPASPDNGDDGFRILGVKFWTDGNMLEAVKGHRARTYDYHDFAQDIREVHQAGWQIAAHTNEEWAVEETLNAYTAAQAASPRADARHRLEHVGFMPPALAQRAASIGATMSFQLNIPHFYGAHLQRHLSPNLLHQIHPVRTARDAGLVYSLHADAPAFPQSPLSLVEIAATRMSEDGDIIGLDQTISVEQALKAITIHAAWQLNMDDKIGSITVGKYADLVVLDHNPLTISVDAISDVKIVHLYIGGIGIF